MELVQQVINSSYTPSVTSAEIYFYACETDQHRSRHLGIDPIFDTMMMTATFRAFSVEHHGEQLQRIAESWVLIYVTTNSPQDEYERFKTHYDRRLTDLYNHNCNAPSAANNQAHSMVDALAEHNNRLFDLESQWNETPSIGETLAPSHVPTNNQALSATDILLQQLVQQVTAMAARKDQAPGAEARPPP